MSAKIQTLKDNDNNLIYPNTLTDAVFNRDGRCLTDEILELTDGMAIERARIDQIVKLPEGSTTGDAELLDIRTKVDGTVADTAGNAVREQVSALDIKIDELNLKIDSMEPSSGEAGGDNAELVDIRLKADGTVADTAGNAVREQITELNEKLAQRNLNMYNQLYQIDPSYEVSNFNYSNMPEYSMVYYHINNSNRTAAYENGLIPADVVGVLTIIRSGRGYIEFHVQGSKTYYANVNFTEIVNNSDIEWVLNATTTHVNDLRTEMDEELATRNLTTYTSVTQLNLSGDNTMDEVMAALPLNSELIHVPSKTPSTLSECYPTVAAAKVTYYKSSTHERGCVKWERVSDHDQVFINRYVNGAFQGWKRYVNEDDIATINENLGKKFDKTGGTLSGDAYVDKSDTTESARIGVITSKKELRIVSEGISGNGGLYDTTNSKYLTYSDVNGKVYVDDVAVEDLALNSDLMGLHIKTAFKTLSAQGTTYASIGTNIDISKAFIISGMASKSGENKWNDITKYDGVISCSLNLNNDGYAQLRFDAISEAETTPYDVRVLVGIIN